MALNFVFQKLTFKKHPIEKWLVVQGEIINNSGISFQSVVFRMVVFIRTTPIASIPFTINGFYAGQVKTFEQQVGEIEYEVVASDISKVDIYAEGGY